MEKSRSVRSNRMRRILTAPYFDPHDQKSRLRAFVRTIILGISDSQTILAIAFGFNFAAMSKCSLTSYHYGVALDTILITCSSMVLSVAMVRDYWESPLAALIRWLMMTFVFVCLGVTLVYEEQWSHSPEWPPGHQQTDSLVLLPVACLLEGDLFSQLNASLSPEQASYLHIGQLSNPGQEFLMYIFLAGAYGLAHLAHIVRSVVHRPKDGKLPWLKEGSPRAIATVIYWLFVLITPTAISFLCWVDISQARTWASNSGWLNGDGPNNTNPEERLFDIGQFLPLLTAGLWVITLAEKSNIRSPKYATYSKV